MKRILFLTTVPPDIIGTSVSDHEWSNDMLPSHLSKRGASVSIKRWTDEDIITSMLDSDVVTFLWAEDYYQNHIAFEEFLLTAKRAIETVGQQHGATHPRVINHIDLVQWNMDKKYLLDMRDAGFDIPMTEIVDAEPFTGTSALHQRLQAFQSSGPVVLKPSVSASSNNTRLIPDISALSADDDVYLELCVKGRLGSSLVVQRFESAIATGEYSFVFIGEQLSHIVLNLPPKRASSAASPNLVARVVAYRLSKLRRQRCRW